MKSMTAPSSDFDSSKYATFVEIMLFYGNAVIVEAAFGLSADGEIIAVSPSCDGMTVFQADQRMK